MYEHIRLGNLYEYDSMHYRQIKQSTVIWSAREKVAQAHERETFLNCSQMRLFIYFFLKNRYLMALIVCLSIYCNYRNEVIFEPPSCEFE